MGEEVEEVKNAGDPIQEFLKKHRPMSPDDIMKTVKEAGEVRKRYSQDIADVEKNLLNWKNRLDPLINPAEDVAIAWIRQVPYAELQDMKPEGMGETKDMSDEELTERIEETTDMDYAFTLMERLIAIPEKTAQEWKEFADVELIRLFDARLTQLFSRLMEQTDFF